MMEDYKNKVSYLEILVYRLNNLISYLLENSDEATKLYEDYKAKKNDKDIKKELERLSEKDKKIERLNNIINEFDRYIDEIIDERIERIEGARFLKGGFTIEQNFLRKMLHEKLQELKGSDKE